MMKATRLYLLLAVLMCCVAASAQRRLVVVDVETMESIDGANVIGNSLSTQTDTMGYVTVPDSCRSLLFSHVNYESRLINLKEVRDTVFLISKLLNVKEVVVFGQAQYKDEYEGLRKNMRPKILDMQLADAEPGDGINLLGLVGYIMPKKWKKSRKQKRKESKKQIIEEY